MTMENDAIQLEDEGSAALLEDAEMGAAGRQRGRGAKPQAFHKLQMIVPWKTVVTLGDISYKRLKKGQDLSRSRLVCEAIELLAARESGAKSAGKDEAGGGR